ncbi:MAG: OmpA family protein [Proteobacteria bacterium]|nr:OmpA family protein [Pseudomonadota bacterium]
MTSAARQNREIEQLKTMLFQTETARLATMETDVASLQRYVGSAARLEVATADVLVAALERAEVDRPRELANAIAPTVVSVIRSEIRNSRDLMVDALYPITGRLVSAAVANAFKELIALLEQRLNALTSTELWVGRVKSLVTGRPISEFVLADSPPRVERLLMIERGSGRLVADWTHEASPDNRADLLSAMVAAILEFSVQALAEEGNLQKLDFGGRELVLRASPRFILAAECVGPLRPADDSRINALFFDTIESMDRGSACDSAALASLATSIEADPRSRKKGNRGGRAALLVLAGLAIALLGWWAVLSVTRTMLERRATAALQQLADEQPSLTSFPLRLDFDHPGRSLTVRGIEPSQVNIAAVMDALAKAAAPYRIIDRIGVVPGLEQWTASRTDAAATQQSLARLQASLDEVHKAIAEEARSRSQQYAKLQSTVDSPAERLSRFMASTAIFFGIDDEFTDREEADRQIRQLAALLENNDLEVRVVGYTDDTGSEAGNRALARRRAEVVVQKLTALGIEPSRLLVVSRAASMPISDKTGPNDGNRRVTFENVFRGEPTR